MFAGLGAKSGFSGAVTVGEQHTFTDFGLWLVSECLAFIEQFRIKLIFAYATTTHAGTWEIDKSPR